MRVWFEITPKSSPVIKVLKFDIWPSLILTHLACVPGRHTTPLKSCLILINPAI
jgi:hypothetical protein